MSHELRTPLNSLLILSDQLSRNPERQPRRRSRCEFAQDDPLRRATTSCTLINDILDLSKIESGTVVVDIGGLRARRICSNYVERTFRHVAEAKRLEFRIEHRPDAAARHRDRLQAPAAGLKNLLSNAFKFTERGEVVALASTRSASGWSTEHET